MTLQGTNSSAKNTEREIKLHGTRFRTPMGRRSEQVDVEILRSGRHVPLAGLILGVHGRGRCRRFPCDVPIEGTRSIVRPTWRSTWLVGLWESERGFHGIRLAANGKWAKGTSEIIIFPGSCLIGLGNCCGSRLSDKHDQSYLEMRPFYLFFNLAGNPPTRAPDYVMQNQNHPLQTWKHSELYYNLCI